VRRDLVERPLGGADEAGPEQQVLGRVARDRQLGKERQVAALATGLLEPVDDQVAIAFQVADDGVDLCEREPQCLRLPVENLVYRCGAGDR
jgi:hypothetical protein